MSERFSRSYGVDRAEGASTGVDKSTGVLECSAGSAEGAKEHERLAEDYEGAALRERFSLSG